MTTGPVNQTGSSATTKALGEAAKKSKNPALVMLGLAATAFSGMMVKDSFVGTRAKRRDAAAEVEQRNQYNYMQSGWGLWSGNPGMDQMSQRARRFMMFGPMNLGMKWQQFRAKTNSLVNDVLLPNLLPISIAATTAYAGLGPKNVNKAMKALGKPFKSIAASPMLKQSFGGLGKAIGGGLGTAAKGLGKLFFSSPAGLALGIGGALLGGFALHRFKRTYSGEAQQDHFRDFISNKNVRY